MYPKQKYALQGGSITVEDAAHEHVLGPQWLDNPPLKFALAAEPEPEPEVIAPRKKK